MLKLQTPIKHTLLFRNSLVYRGGEKSTPIAQIKGIKRLVSKESFQ